MERFVIVGGQKLNGTVNVPKAKNAFLPIMCASILCDQTVVLRHFPHYLDTLNFCKILNFLGKKTSQKNGDLKISQKATKTVVPKVLASKLRSSFFCLGALLAKHKKAKISMPGGCNIGKRPVDLHLFGLKKLGVTVKRTKNFLVFDGKNMHNADINLLFPSVGATENLMMASVFLKGKTKIFNAAKEPEIVDLANFLNKMGANIKGAGTNKIEICGVEKLKGTSHTPIPDRIFVGTLLIACAICGGKLKLKNCNPCHVKSLTKTLTKCGCKICEKKTQIVLKSSGKNKAPKVLNTNPYPGFATDLQSQMLVLCCFASGTSILKENIFENRFKTAQELKKMGADIKIQNNTAVVVGQKTLYGQVVRACDLRGGAALVLAGLRAEGTTMVEDVFHIKRGYQNFEKTLQSLGANIVKKH